MRAAAVLFLCLSACKPEAKPEPGPQPQVLPPNVLIFVADDLGVEKMASYGVSGESQPFTPALDALAERSVVLRRAYSHPVCTPTRASSLTGRYPFRTGLGAGMEAMDTYGLRLSERTLPEALSEFAHDAWSTAVIGKWHLSSLVTDGQDGPRRHGFDHHAGSLGNLESSWTSDGMPQSYTAFERVVDGVPGRVEDYVTSVEADDAIAWIAGAQEPFFGWVAFHAPHAPYHLPPEGLYNTPMPDGPPTNARYFDRMVEAMDHEVGRVLDSMSPALRARTVVIFLGDNGTPSDVLEVPAKKFVNERGVNVPMLISGPGVVPREEAGLVSVVDLFSTTLGIAGVALPDEPERLVDGINLWPALQDPSLPWPRDRVFAEAFKPNGPDDWKVRQRMIRDERFKLVSWVDFEGDAQQFGIYDLPNAFDLESENLYGRKDRPDARAAFYRLIGELEDLTGEAF